MSISFPTVFPKGEDAAMKAALVNLSVAREDDENLVADGFLIDGKPVPVIWREPDERFPGTLPCITVERVNFLDDLQTVGRFINETICVSGEGTTVVLKRAPYPVLLNYRVAAWSFKQRHISEMTLFIMQKLGVHALLVIRGAERKIDFLNSIRLQFPEHKHRVMGLGLNYSLWSFVEDDVIQSTTIVEIVESRCVSLFTPSIFSDLTIPYDNQGNFDRDLLNLFFFFDFDAA